MRTILDASSKVNGLYFDGIKGRQDVIDYKALLRRSNNRYSVKVGWFNTPSRIGQVAEAAGTALIPGDISPVRSPIRSGVYSALTPGGLLPGVGGGAPSRTERGYRCPEGFQYGGRFTDNRFSTCGQMLFDIFSLGTAVGQMIRPIGPQSLRAEAGGAGSPIPGLSLRDQQIIISRAAQIPRIGPADQGRKAKSVEDAIKALSNAEDGVTLMIRRDGFGLRPVVSTAILRTVPDNRNMEGATFLTAVRDPLSVGKDELGLLSNTGVTDLTYVAQNEITFGLRKARPLTVGERRKLGRTVAKVAGSDTSDDPTARLKAVAAELPGAIEYFEQFGDVSKPNDIISVRVNGKQRQMRRWAYEAFVKGSKKPVRQPLEREEVTETNDEALTGKITSLAAAVRHLDAGGDPGKVLASLLPVALQRARGYQSRRVDRFTKLHNRSGINQITESASEYEFEHLHARVSSDIQKYIGLDAPRVLLGGQGRRAPYFTVADARQMASVKPADNLDNAPPAQVLALAISDYLLDHRDRQPATTRIVDIGGRTYIRSANNKLTLLSGIPSARQSARQRLGVDQTLNEDRAQYYAAAFRKLTEQQRRAIIGQLDGILRRLSGFSWDEYIQRLTLDGDLSAAEKNHLKIVRSIVETRLSTLKSSKQAFFKLLTQTA